MRGDLRKEGKFKEAGETERMKGNWKEAKMKKKEEMKKRSKEGRKFSTKLRKC